MLVSYSLLILILWCMTSFIVFLIVMNKIRTDIQLYLSNKESYDNLDKLMQILDNSKELAFRKIYMEKILVHYGSGYKLNRDEINKYGREYVRLTIDFCGKDVYNKLVKVFGVETLCMRLLESFSNRLNIENSNITIQQLYDIKNDNQ